MTNTTATTTANTIASYEETAIVTTYTYSATVVTEQGETTAVLTARQDLDCPRRREIACPGNCNCHYQLRWNINLQQYEPVQCNNCNIALYDIHFVPAVVAEPAAPAVAEPVASEVAAKVDAMIERVDSELASVEPGPVEEPAPLKPVDPNKKQYFVVWATSQSDDSKKYALLCQKATGFAINCSCPDRVNRGRKAGRACKHMTAHNDMLKPATQQEAA